MKQHSATDVTSLIAGVVLGLLGLVLPLPASAWVAPPTDLLGLYDDDVVLIVAQEDYLFWQPIEGAKANGEAWEAYFRETLGMSAVTLLNNASASELGTQVAEVAKAAKDAESAERLWFVYIGHGTATTSSADVLEPMLLGVDAKVERPGALKSTALMRQELLETLAGSGLEVVVVLDACMSSYVEGDQNAAPHDLLHLPSIPDKVLVLAAAGPGEATGQLDDVARPAFSYLLLESLAVGDANNDGTVTATEAIAYAGAEIKTRRKGKTRQTPRLEAPDGQLDVYGQWGLGWPAPCAAGMERSSDTQGHCCWPGQVWSTTREQCIDQPTHCPAEMTAVANGCELASTARVAACDPSDLAMLALHDELSRAFAERYDAALEVLERMEAQCAADPYVDYTRAVLLVRTGDCSGALEALDQAKAKLAAAPDGWLIDAVLVADKRSRVEKTCGEQ